LTELLLLEIFADSLQRFFPMSHRLEDDPVRLFHEVGQLILYPAIA
jgi:hypothetical protein